MNTSTFKTVSVFLLVAMLLAMIPMAMIASEGMGTAVKGTGNLQTQGEKSLEAPAVVKPRPLTQHAKLSHMNRTWNAPKIQSFFLEGGCIPREYSCMATDVVIQYCEIKPGLSIGLIIGKVTDTIVTGFSGSTHKWQNNCH